MKTNYVSVVGAIGCEPVYDYTDHGEDFYKTTIQIRRESGTVDEIPVILSGWLFDQNEVLCGKMVKIQGSFRSHNKYEGEKRHLILNIFAERMGEAEEENERENNLIELDAYICKPPVYRLTQKGREIADLFVAVNRANGQSDYLPCIVWGRTAKWAGKLPVGSRLKISGRLQSRDYTKWLNEAESEVRRAYEVSVGEISLIREKNLCDM